MNTPKPVASPVTLSAMDLVMQERHRQIEVEKWTPESDDFFHKNGQMADAACCYARVAAMICYPGPVPLNVPERWPWDHVWWKPSSDPIRNLVKSAALIVAEIERLQRKSAVTLSEGQDTQEKKS